MPDVIEKYATKPFGEAVSFFREKLNVPSEHWDDLWKGQHAKGFMVAGAMKAELVSDLKGSVDKAISQGETLADFRKRFDSIVEKHGWTYKGGRNWRTKVIYDTNLKTAYMAGRHKQMTSPGVTTLRPFWQYRHGGSANPRIEHLALDGMVLPHDDPFWSTHYPPNGWGCKCRVVTLSQRDLDKMGKKGPDSAPEIQYREWEDKNGKSHQVPLGIDPGWDYNVGKETGRSYKALAERFESMDNAIARAWMGESLEGPAFKKFFTDKDIGEFPVAVLKPADQVALETRGQTVWLSRQTLDEHKIAHPEIGLKDYRKIPEILETGEVYKQGDARLVYLNQDDKFYRAALKRTADRKENYYLTLFKTSEDKAEKEVRRKLERVR
ncbi:MAG: hypothetical protein JEZ12_24020 [Desulfobacterium sp.]|nr:hypothetical protein [Desulfobacterium sp.]